MNSNNANTSQQNIQLAVEYNDILKQFDTDFNKINNRQENIFAGIMFGSPYDFMLDTKFDVSDELKNINKNKQTHPEIKKLIDKCCQDGEITFEDMYILVYDITNNKNITTKDKKTTLEAIARIRTEKENSRKTVSSVVGYAMIFLGAGSTTLSVLSAIGTIVIPHWAAITSLVIVGVFAVYTAGNRITNIVKCVIVINQNDRLKKLQQKTVEAKKTINNQYEQNITRAQQQAMYKQVNKINNVVTDQLNEREEKINQQNIKIEEQNNKIEEQDKQILNLKQTLKYKQEQIESKDRTLDKKDKEIQEKGKKIEELQQNELKNKLNNDNQNFSQFFHPSHIGHEEFKKNNNMNKPTFQPAGGLFNSNDVFGKKNNIIPNTLDNNKDKENNPMSMFGMPPLDNNTNGQNKNKNINNINTSNNNNPFINNQNYAEQNNKPEPNFDLFNALLNNKTSKNNEPTEHKQENLNSNNTMPHLNNIKPNANIPQGPNFFNLFNDQNQHNNPTSMFMSKEGNNNNNPIENNSNNKQNMKNTQMFTNTPNTPIGNNQNNNPHNILSKNPFIKPNNKCHDEHCNCNHKVNQQNNNPQDFNPYTAGFDENAKSINDFLKIFKSPPIQFEQIKNNSEKIPNNNLQITNNSNNTVYNSKYSKLTTPPPSVYNKEKKNVNFQIQSNVTNTNNKDNNLNNLN